MSGHLEEVVCPMCYSVETAEVKHTRPFWTYIHECKNCNHTITESEWQYPLKKE